MLTKISSSVIKATKNSHRQFRRVDWSLSSLQWNHDTSTLVRSETNEVAERAVRKVKEGTARAEVDNQKNGGTVRRNSVVTCATCTARWPMARQHSRNDTARNFDEPSIPFGTLVDCIPITAKEKSRIHQFGQKKMKGIFSGDALRAGRGWLGDLMIALYDDLLKSEAADIYVKRFKNKNSS